MGEAERGRRARECLSPEHLARLIERHTGASFIEFIQRMRIDHARQLLLETNRTILDIALDCGFGSHEPFICAVIDHVVVISVLTECSFVMSPRR